MEHPKSELRFLLLLLAGVGLLAYFIFKPFLFAMLLAVVFATVFQPVHAKIFQRVKNRAGLAALLATISVLLVVIAPLSLLGFQIVQESAQLYRVLVNDGGAANLSAQITDIARRLLSLSPVPIDLNIDVSQYIKLALNWVAQNLGAFFSNVTQVLLGIFIFLVALFYLFKDGVRVKKMVLKLSPLQDMHDEVIFRKLAAAINSVVRGNLAIAFIQGVLTTIGFAIFGVPNAALWGSVTVVAALIPGVGTALVLIPGIIYLFITGDLFQAVGLLIWGVVAVGLIDNFLGPKLVEKGIRLHPFIILLSILGGLSFFGPLGFLIGPLVVSLLFALVDIYFDIRAEHANRDLSK